MALPTILILGASYAGLDIAHKLLKHTRPSVQLKVVLVSTMTHHYWNMASVRAIVPGTIPDHEMFQEIAPGFKMYPARNFSLIIGAATSVDTTSKSVTISTATGPLQQSYDHLVIATGVHTKGDVPWKGKGSYEETLALLHSYQSRVATAKSIVICGAGATGVETAGELGFQYGKTREITLITSSEQVLEGSVTPKIAAGIEKDLASLGVKIIRDTMVSHTEEMEGGGTKMMLSSGEEIEVDLYLPTWGVEPSTEYLEKRLLNPNGEVMVDGFLRAKGVPDGSVWAAGDVSDVERCQIVTTMRQSKHVARNLDAVLKGKSPVEYKKGQNIIAVTIGKKKGSGQMGKSRKVPYLLIFFVKQRTNLGSKKINETIMGTAA